MTNTAVDTILQHMIHDEHSDIQAIQTAHRLDLIEQWQIHPGEKILEIGSGQGDMLAALAYAVGATGHVTGVDIANADYGAPYTLGQAIDVLKASDFGPRLQVFFEQDISRDVSFLAGEHFDRVVFAHSAWYFQSLAQLQATLAVAKTLADEILFAEWDLEITDIAQQNHFLAASVQGQLGAFRPEQQANIRTLVTKHQLRMMADTLGMVVTQAGSIDSGQMQDGDWEVSYVKHSFTLDHLLQQGVPEPLAAFLAAQIALIHGDTKPLNTFWMRISA